MKSKVSLKEIDSIEIVSLMDNTIDLTSTIKQKEVQKFREWRKNDPPYPVAEHGFSILVKTKLDKTFHTILFDTGLSSEGIVKNASIMGINLTDIECIVLSHGHYDHFGGLLSVIKAINREDLPIIVHEDVFKIRGLKNKNGSIRKYPRIPSRNEISPSKFVYINETTQLIGSHSVVTGEIPRVIDFEKGFPGHCEYSGKKWISDTKIFDDRAIIFNVKNKGLVVVTGCAHAGIINTIYNAQKITGISKIFGILGGFHLSGSYFEKRIDQTIKKLREVNPKIIVPMHCSGWRGKNGLFQSFPDAFIWNSVGNLYSF